MRAQNPGRPGQRRFLRRGGAVVVLTVCIAAILGSAHAASSAPCGQADHLVFTSSPTDVKVSTAFAVTVAIQDACGDLVKGAHNPVTLSLADPASADAGGGGTLGGTTSTPAAGGIAAFSGLTINESGIGYTLTASYEGVLPLSTAVNVHDTFVSCPNGCNASASNRAGTVAVTVPTGGPAGSLGISLTDPDNAGVTVTCTLSDGTTLRDAHPLGSIFNVSPPGIHAKADITVTLTINKFYVGTTGIASIITCMSSTAGATYQQLKSCPSRGTSDVKCIAKQSANKAGDAVIVLKIDSDPFGGGFG
jgi:hypothetical protein